MKRSCLLGLAGIFAAACATPLAAGDGGDAADRGVDSPTDPMTDRQPDLGTDAPPDAPADPPAETDVSSMPYRHTIAIDGTNDFATTAEAFATTSSGYGAYLTWDANAIYVGYDGADVASGDPNKWIFVYLDVNPGVGIGATMGEQYATQRPGFPPGFGAEYYFRWKADNTFQDLRAYSGGAWSTVAGATPTTYQNGTFVETRIALSDLGYPSGVGVVTLMMDEVALGEWSYAGLYAGSFTDGYYDAATSAVPIGYYLLADFSLPDAPDATTRRRP